MTAKREHTRTRECAVARGRRVRTEGAGAALGPRLYHEILNEPERERVVEDILGWLDARAPE